jgi:hypothetical protein
MGGQLELSKNGTAEPESASSLLRHAFHAADFAFSASESLSVGYYGGQGTLYSIARIFVGIVLVLLGIAGALLPIIPGFLFLIPGLVILSDYCPPIKRLLDWARERYEKEKQARIPKTPAKHEEM